jgi:hypothetical protein
MVTRGYPSITYLHEAAETIEDEGKPTFLYYLGDHDPSGEDITRAVREGIEEFAPDAEIYFERIAVTQQQINEMNLPTRPTKTSDTRHKNFDGESVEVDAIPPSDLREMVEECIEFHVDADALERTKRIERAEREMMKEIRLPPRNMHKDDDDDAD